MILHSIISELDIFFLPADYLNPQYEQKKQSYTNIIPCITNPAELRKGSRNPYYQK
jgi:hypothetical protein